MKAPSPKADQLRELGEAKRARLNAEPRKLIPYAGKETGARDDLMGNKPPNTKPPRVRRKYKRKIA